MPSMMVGNMAELLVHFRDGTKTTVPLSTRPIKIGRADSCEIVLRNDSEISREHAEVWLDENGRVLVADMNSKNGTRVDGGELFKNATRPAYRSIRLGEHEIDVIGAPPAARKAPAVVEFAPDSPVGSGDTRFFPSSKRLDLNQQRLALLISLTERIGGVFERKQLLEQALDACCEALRFERGMILVKTPRGETELPLTRNVQQDETGAYKISRTIINRALIQGERAVVNNPATDLMGDLSESLVRFPICSALCVPILNRGEILGVIYGDRITRADTYTPEDVDFFAAIAQQVGTGLANLRLFHEHLRSQKMYAELAAARNIQQQLLPSAPLKLGKLTVAGYNEPSSAVSGDYYDYFDLGDGRIGFIIADVTGHGLPAALLMTNLQAALHVALSGGTALQDLTTRINALICRNTSSTVFITAVLGTVDQQSGVIEFVSAGHPGPLVLGGDRVRLSLLDNSLPLGLEPGEPYSVQRVDPGGESASVLFYTDGLIEASDAKGNPLGLDAVVSSLSAQRDRGTTTLLNTARNTLREHLNGQSNADDMTLLALHFET